MCFTSCQAVVWAACGALYLSFPERNSIAFFLVYKILMIPIAIIINNIMIALVTVIVVITGITIMNTCFSYCWFLIMLLR